MRSVWGQFRKPLRINKQQKAKLKTSHEPHKLACGAKFSSFQHKLGQETGDESMTVEAD